MAEGDSTPSTTTPSAVECKITPGGSFNFFGMTLVKLDLKTAATSGTGAAIKLPKGFVPVTIWQPALNNMSVAVAAPVGTSNCYTATPTVTAAGKAEVYIVGHY